MYWLLVYLNGRRPSVCTRAPSVALALSSDLVLDQIRDIALHLTQYEDSTPASFTCEIQILHQILIFQKDKGRIQQFPLEFKKNLVIRRIEGLRVGF